MDANACRWCGTGIVEGTEKCPTCGARVAPARPEPAVEPAAAGTGWAATSTAPSITPAWASPAAASAPPAAAGTMPPVSAPVPTADVPAPPPPGMVVAPPGAWTPTASPERTGMHPVVWLAIAALVAMAGFVGWRMLAGDVVRFPDSILGQPRMSGPIVDPVIDTIEDTRVAGATFRAAFYGGTSPVLMIVVADSSSLGDPESTWAGFGGGFGSTSGASVNERGKVSSTIGGVNYICAPVTDMAATVCQWTDARTTGYVFDYTVGDAEASIARAQTVYEAVVGA